MQLQSIDQVSLNMEVWHPLWGKGEVIYKGEKHIEVQLKENPFNTIFLLDSFAKENDLIMRNYISHLYDEPVYICTRVQYKYGTQRFEPHYLPTK